MKYRAILFLLLGLGLVGCKQMQQMGKAADACYPGQPALHVVELDKLKLNEADFTTNLMGDPYPIKIYLLEDGTEIQAVNGGSVSGMRGTRELDSPIRWDVDFKPDCNYQIVVEEQSGDDDHAMYVFPAEGRPGFWPVPANDGTFRFGRGSFVHFSEEVK